MLSVNGPRSLVETGGEIIPVIDIAALLKLKDYDKKDSVLVILDEFEKKPCRLTGSSTSAIFR